MNIEASFDISKKSVENLKNIIDSEFKEISNRFYEGKETLDDLLNNYRHFKIIMVDKKSKEHELEVVELKYYKKLIEEIKKKSKILDLMAEQLTTPVNSKEWVIKYYTEKVEEENC